MMSWLLHFDVSTGLSMTATPHKTYPPQISPVTKPDRKRDALRSGVSSNAAPIHYRTRSSYNNYAVGAAMVAAPKKPTAAPTKAITSRISIVIMGLIFFLAMSHQQKTVTIKGSSLG